MTKWVMQVPTLTPPILNLEDLLSEVADTLDDGHEDQFELVEDLFELAVTEVAKEAMFNTCISSCK